MAYVTAALVQAEFKSLDGSTSGAAITTAKITEFIAQEEATLDGLVSTVYETPVVEATSPLAFAIMKMLSTLLIKARIEAILAVKTGDKKPDQGDDKNPNYQKAMDLIEKIRTKEMKLPDGTLANTTGAVKSYSSANDLSATFQKGSVQW